METQPTYIVIGATGGIGSAMSRRLARSSNLVLAGRREDRLSALAKDLNALHRVADATRLDDVQALFQDGADRFGRVDGIVNCAGTILLKPAHLISDEEFDETIAANLRTAFNTVKVGARAMMSDGGSIVLCSSAVALTGIANHDAISAAKAGVVGLTRAAAATYANRNIRVNCVAPGLTRTPLSQFITENETSEKKSISMHALGRLGKPEDIASAICWLLDPDNDWVTGQMIGVDGGLGTLQPR